MCGIVGIISQQDIPRELVNEMTDQLRHRGPDAGNVFVSKEVCLGHRRLSIIDLNDQSNQPMVSSCGRYILVFNGEIYNYQELRELLITEHQATFHTQSDSEVIIEAYKQWGSIAVKRFNGMFAFALLDQHTHHVFLGRDRLGIKPLYVYQRQGVIAFASELKGLLPLTKYFGKLHLDMTASRLFFRLGYIPAPRSIYQEITKFLPGHYAIIKHGELTMESYWELKDEVRSEVQTNEKIAQTELHDLLVDSIDLRLRSDVPFGTFLSGGVDSSLVSAIAASRSQEAINTFSIGFEHPKYDESVFAREVAQAIGANHHEFHVTLADAQELLPRIHEVYDEPFADTSAIPTYLVAQLASKEVKMVLSGDGGDEQFLGYGMYQWANRLQNPVIRASRKIIYQGLRLSGKNKWKRAAEMFNYRSDDNPLAHIFSVDQYLFSAEENRKLMRETSELYGDFSRLSRYLSAAEQQAFFDLSYYLPDDLLVKVDRASMQHGLEVRVPLLDHRVVEWSVNLSEQLKVRNGQTKWLLKEVLSDYVSRDLWDRPKWGFSVPLEEWLQHDLHFLIEKHVLNSASSQALQLNHAYIAKLVNRFNAGETYLYNKLWLLIQFDLWWRSNQHYFHS